MTFVASSPSEAVLPVLQRTRGEAVVGFRSDLGRTVLDRLRQDGAAKLRLPRLSPGEPAQAVLINTAGGLTGGDRFRIRIDLGQGARALVTTQACEKIYRSRGDTAEISTRISIGRDARLDWLPQETILFDHARLARSLDVDLAEGASLLALEAVIFGRTAMAETVSAGSFHDRWRVRREGKLVFADDLRLGGDLGRLLARPAVLGGCRATATLLYVAADAEALLDRARAAISEAGGVSAWSGKLVARLAASDGFALRRTITALAAILLGGAELPKVWHL